MWRSGWRRDGYPTEPESGHAESVSSGSIRIHSGSKPCAGSISNAGATAAPAAANLGTRVATRLAVTIRTGEAPDYAGLAN